MDKNKIWKWIILVGLTAWSISSVSPLTDKKDSEGHVTRRGKIRLGIDLAGGSRFVLQVDTKDLAPEVARDAQSRALEVIRNRVDSMGIAEPVIYTEPGNRIVVEVPGISPEDRDRTLKNLESAAFLEFRMVHAKSEEFIDQLMTKGLAPAGYRIVEAAEMGHSRKYYKRDTTKDIAGVSEGEVRHRAANFEPHAGYELLLEKVSIGGQELFRPHYVSKRRELTGDSLSDAGFEYDQVGRPYVTIKFDSKGAKRFANLTRDYAPGGAQNPSMNQQRQLGIVLDGTLYSAPAIREPILGGNAQITGNFTLKESQDLSIILRAGALPAPVSLLEERTIAPTLGQDSIDSGKRATIIGGAAVMLFMLAYYMMAGAVANIALIMNIVLLPLGLVIASGLFSLLAPQGPSEAVGSLPTLTLPGIAGIALTIGMAVDANVLIYERMREEQASGKRFKFVVEAGYDKAFSAIFDSNITTLLSAAILFWQGSGPIRGYAVTLSAGIIVSMYTALMCTHMIFDLMVEKTNIIKLNMLHVVRATNIDFLGKRYIYVGISVVIIAVGWIGMITKGKEIFAVDFTGGASITYSFEKKQPLEKVRDALAEAGLANVMIQYQKVGGQAGAAQVEDLEIRAAFDQGSKVTETIKAKFPDSGYKVTQEDKVGPQIGAELQKKAVIAIVLSMLVIGIYVSFRFEFPFAIGTILSLLHDALMAPGIYCLMGHKLNVSMVAAILTIIGYSVNDTIVIFDRIRENLKLSPGKPFFDVANESINQTLGRTILTTFVTLLSVIALLAFGGGAIHDFALLLFIGMLSGVYSTVYIATPMVLLWHNDKRASVTAKKA